jgi:hypothetical protein
VVEAIVAAMKESQTIWAFREFFKEEKPHDRTAAGGAKETSGPLTHPS